MKQMFGSYLTNIIIYLLVLLILTNIKCAKMVSQSVRPPSSDNFNTYYENDDSTLVDPEEIEENSNILTQLSEYIISFPSTRKLHELNNIKHQHKSVMSENIIPVTGSWGDHVNLPCPALHSYLEFRGFVTTPPTNNDLKNDYVAKNKTFLSKIRKRHSANRRMRNKWYSSMTRTKVDTDNIVTKWYKVEHQGMRYNQNAPKNQDSAMKINANNSILSPIYIVLIPYVPHVRPDYAVRTTFNAQTSELKISNLTFNDEGYFVCKIVYLKKPAETKGYTSFVNLQIQAKPKILVSHSHTDFFDSTKPNHNRETNAFSTSSQIYANLGGRIDINCTAVGIPEPQISWTRTIKNLQVGLNPTSLENSLDPAFALPNDYQQPSSTSNFGNTVRLKRRQLNVPRQYSHNYWMAANNEYGGKLKSAKSIMSIPLVTLAHRNVIYTCLAKNDQGTATHSYEITISESPKIVLPPQNLTTLEGLAARFDCGAQAFPSNVTHTWLKDGSLLSQKTDFGSRIIYHAMTGAMTINPTFKSDNGQYSCVVENGVNPKAQASAYLDIQYPASINDKALKTKQYLPQGLFGAIQCPVLSNPNLEFVIWTKNGKTIDSSLETILAKTDENNNNGNYRTSTLLPEFNNLIHQIEPSNNVDIVPSETNNDNINTLTLQKNISEPYRIARNGSLFIFQVDRKIHEAVYTCTPYNKIGTNGPSVPIHVYVKDPPIIIRRPNKQYIVAAGQSLTIPCSFGGKPNPSIIWKRENGKDLPRGHFFYALGNLTITSVGKEDHGIIYCIGTNKVATITIPISIIVYNTSPHMPINISVRSSVYGAYIRWKPGYNGGHTTRYIVWCSKIKSTFTTTPSVRAGALDAEANHKLDTEPAYAYYFNTSSGYILDLESASSYTFQLQAYNMYGYSEKSPPLLINTKKFESEYYTMSSLQGLSQRAAQDLQGELHSPTYISTIYIKGGNGKDVLSFGGKDMIYPKGILIKWENIPRGTINGPIFYILEYSINEEIQWYKWEPAVKASEHANKKYITLFIREEDLLKALKTSSIPSVLRFRVRAYDLNSKSDPSIVSELYIINSPRKLMGTPIVAGIITGTALSIILLTLFTMLTMAYYNKLTGRKGRKTGKVDSFSKFGLCGGAEIPYNGDMIHRPNKFGELDGDSNTDIYSSYITNQHGSSQNTTLNKQENGDLGHMHVNGHIHNQIKDVSDKGQLNGAYKSNNGHIRSIEPKTSHKQCSTLLHTESRQPIWNSNISTNPELFSSYKFNFLVPCDKKGEKQLSDYHNEFHKYPSTQKFWQLLFNGFGPIVLPIPRNGDDRSDIKAKTYEPSALKNNFHKRYQQRSNGGNAKTWLKMFNPINVFGGTFSKLFASNGSKTEGSQFKISTKRNNGMIVDETDVVQENGGIVPQKGMECICEKIENITVNDSHKNQNGHIQIKQDDNIIYIQNANKSDKNSPKSKIYCNCPANLKSPNSLESQTSQSSNIYNFIEKKSNLGCRCKRLCHQPDIPTNLVQRASSLLYKYLQIVVNEAVHRIIEPHANEIIHPNEKAKNTTMSSDDTVTSGTYCLVDNCKNNPSRYGLSKSDIRIIMNSTTCTLDDDFSSHLEQVIDNSIKGQCDSFFDSTICSNTTIPSENKCQAKQVGNQEPKILSRNLTIDSSKAPLDIGLQPIYEPLYESMEHHLENYTLKTKDPTLTDSLSNPTIPNGTKPNDVIYIDYVNHNTSSNPLIYDKKTNSGPISNASESNENHNKELEVRFVEMNKRKELSNYCHPTHSFSERLPSFTNSMQSFNLENRLSSTIV